MRPGKGNRMANDLIHEHLNGKIAKFSKRKGVKGVQKAAKVIGILSRSRNCMMKNHKGK